MRPLSRPPAAAAFPTAPLGETARAVRRAAKHAAALPASASGGPWRDVLALAIFGGATAILFFPALTRGAIRWQSDTRYFYFPLLSQVAAALKQGRLPLWEPGLFGGYPLLADGESGMLYPPHLILLRLLDPAAALIALRCLRFFLAGSFTYAFLRAIAASRTSSIVAGLVFMLSGFMAGQVVHENLDAGMVWLPLVLAFLERAVRQTPERPGFRRRRYVAACMAGVALAMQALAVHVQVVVFTVLLVFPYLGWRVLCRDTIGARLPGRLVVGAGIGAVVGFVGAGLSAVQMLPLLDAADRSARGHGIDLAAATINSVTPFQLLTILFPHLLKRPDGLALTYWVEWEVAIYVGIPALFLGAAALAFRRDRYALFFGAAATLSLFLATGRYGPAWVVLVTQDLLGQHGLRSPGRFAFLWSFSAAVLAGLGADWLERRAAGGRGTTPLVSCRAKRGIQTTASAAPALGVKALAAGAGPSLRSGRRGEAASVVARLWLFAVCAALAGFAAGLLLAARAGYLWLVAHPDTARAWLDQRYVRFDPSPVARLKITSGDVYQGLVAALDPHNPATVIWALSIAGGYGLLAAWLIVGQRQGNSVADRGVTRSHERRAVNDPATQEQSTLKGAFGGVPAPRTLQRPALTRSRVIHGPALTVLRAMTVLIVAMPLLAAAAQAHPAATVAALEPDSGAARYLRDQLAPPGAPAGQRPLYRVYTSQPVYLGHTDVEPNALLPLGIQEAGGYSSLSTTVNLAYGWAAETSLGRMLDVWNVRYYLWPRKTADLPSYELTSFHPQRPLLAGSGFNAGATAAFRVPALLGENIRVVATLRDAQRVPAGAVVAWVTATDSDGIDHRWPLRMGMEVAEATAPPTPMAAANDGNPPTTPRPLPVFSWKEYGAGGRPYDVWLYYAKLPLDRPRTITRLLVQVVPVPGVPEATLRLHGLGVGMPDWQVANVAWSDRERFTLVYQDADIQVYRNDAALPRAYLVPEAVRAPAALHLKEMAERSFDPVRMLLIDPAESAGAGSSASNPGGALEGPSEPLGAGRWLTLTPDAPSSSTASAPPATAAAEPAAVPRGLVPRLNDSSPVVHALDPAGRTNHSPAGTTAITRYTGEQVVAQVDATSDAWLFLADTYDPSWHVYVDGAARPVRLANAMFRAVAVPAGHHTVAFRYEPVPLQRGAAISLATGALLLVVLGGSLTWSAVQRWQA